MIFKMIRSMTSNAFDVSSLTKFEERDLLMQDFMTVESTFFPRSGSQQTPAHTHSEYTFRTYAPVAFRYFHKLFGIRREDFLVSYLVPGFSY